MPPSVCETAQKRKRRSRQTSIVSPPLQLSYFLYHHQPPLESSMKDEVQWIHSKQYHTSISVRQLQSYHTWVHHTQFHQIGFHQTGFDHTGFDHTGFDHTGFDHTTGGLWWLWPHTTCFSSGLESLACLEHLKWYLVKIMISWVLLSLEHVWSIISVWCAVILSYYDKLPSLSLVASFIYFPPLFQWQQIKGIEDIWLETYALMAARMVWWITLSWPMDRLVFPPSLFYGGRSQFNPWMKGEFMVEMVDNWLVGLYFNFESRANHNCWIKGATKETIKVPWQPCL